MYVYMCSFCIRVPVASCLPSVFLTPESSVLNNFINRSKGLEDQNTSDRRHHFNKIYVYGSDIHNIRQITEPLNIGLCPTIYFICVTLIHFLKYDIPPSYYYSSLLLKVRDP